MSDNPFPIWGGLGQLAGDAEELANVEREFPRRGSAGGGLHRRDFWKILGAAGALTTLNGCVRQPPEKIVPYVNQPEQIVQGVPLFFATAMPFHGDATGLLVKSHMGHPVKVEGNPRHPLTLGGTHVFAQGSLADLYDKDRSQAVIARGMISTWLGFLDELAAWLSPLSIDRGARIRLLTDTVISPALGAQIKDFLGQYPAARWHQFEAVSRDSERIGAQMAFGQMVNAQYHFDRADIIFSLDSDFLYCGPATPRWARDFATHRGSRDRDRMNRLYVAEACYTSTGACADHRFRVRPSEMEGVLRGLAQAIGAPGGAPAPSDHAWIGAVAKDLLAHRGGAVVLVGEHQPPELHALAHAMNGALGSIGAVVTFTDSNEISPTDQMGSFRELVGEMHAGKVDLLVMTGVNPVYNAPADLGFAEALERVPHRVHHGLYADETAALCQWHIPATTFFEEWSDCQSRDGTASIIQPLIAPLFQGRSKHELLAALNGVPAASPYDVLRAFWRGRHNGADFDEFWLRTLNDGFVAGSTFPTRTLSPKPPGGPVSKPPQEGYELQFRPDECVWDGRWVNNHYLQEIPRPASKLTWDAVVYVSPKTAKEAGIDSGSLVELEFQNRKAQMPVWVEPGHADGCLTAHLGYGRWRAGEPGTHLGYNAYFLRTSAALWSGGGLKVRSLGQPYELASTQTMNSMVGRYPVRLGTVDQFRADPEFAHKEPFEEAALPSQTLYPEWRYDGYKWGMSIDLNACVGCNACVMACNMENNIAVVGKHEVFRYRIMHWLRIDRYYHGAPDEPSLLFQPVPCMQCENAPCELVCPVAATNHSSEGINQMVYNRCVGTRYCSNNCPYKVRRFNFFLYTDWDNSVLDEMRNPDVTPRSRGVMEKCTYCIQRIAGAKITAPEENRPVRDGEIQTACQQACPTQAIVFGDLNDPKSRVSQLKHSSLDYQLLGDVNTRPRTTYMARIFNPNPELSKERS